MQRKPPTICLIVGGVKIFTFLLWLRRFVAKWILRLPYHFLSALMPFSLASALRILDPLRLLAGQEWLLHHQPRIKTLRLASEQCDFYRIMCSSSPESPL